MEDAIVAAGQPTGSVDDRFVERTSSSDTDEVLSTAYVSFGSSLPPRYKRAKALELRLSAFAKSSAIVATLSTSDSSASNLMALLHASLTSGSGAGSSAMRLVVVVQSNSYNRSCISFTTASFAVRLTQPRKSRDVLKEETVRIEGCSLIKEHGPGEARARLSFIQSSE